MNRIITTFVISIVTIVAYAQEFSSRSTSDFMKNAFIEVNSGYGLSNHKTQFFVGEELGYKFFNRLSVFAHHETLYSLRDISGAKNYLNGDVLGGGLGFTLLCDKADRLLCEIHTILGHSIGHSDFNHTLYDAGFFVKFGKCLYSTIGIGYRHVNVHTSGLSDINSFYISVGFGL